MNIDIFPSVLNAEDQDRSTPAYRFENLARWDALNVVVQRTRGGEAWFRDSLGKQHVAPAEHAMLFTHDEPSCYGYPENGSEVYRLRYLTFAIRGLAPVFRSLRETFGPILRMPARSQATTLFDEVYERFNLKAFDDRFQEAELIHRLFIALYREQMQNTRITDPIEYGYHYLRGHLRSPISLKTVASICGVRTCAKINVLF